MNNIEQGSKINHTADPIEQGHIDLVVAIVAQAVQDDKTLEYLDHPDCKNWLDLIGVDSQIMLELVIEYLEKLDKEN